MIRSLYGSFTKRVIDQQSQTIDP